MVCCMLSPAKPIMDPKLPNECNMYIEPRAQSFPTRTLLNKSLRGPIHYQAAEATGNPVVPNEDAKPDRVCPSESPRSEICAKQSSYTSPCKFLIEGKFS